MSGDGTQIYLGNEGDYSLEGYYVLNEYLNRLPWQFFSPSILPEFDNEYTYYITMEYDRINRRGLWSIGEIFFPTRDCPPFQEQTAKWSGD